MATPFIPRAIFPILDSLPRSYYLGHHAAGLAKMKTLLSQIDFVIECRDYRIPLASRNPMFEDVLAGKERIVVYTKKDLACGGGGNGRGKDVKRHENLLRNFYQPTPVSFSDTKSLKDVRRILDIIKARSFARSGGTLLTGSHCMVVGMPNVGKSSLLNALRHAGVRKGKVAHTGAQPGVTRKIGTGVKIVEGSTSEGDSSAGGGVYLLDTPGVFIPYVPDATAMLKLALCGSVKDNVVPPFTLADYLLFHVNNHSPEVYGDYHTPTNDVTELLDAMARKTGRLQKGGTVDLDGTAMWMVQRWRGGHLGRFLLDEVSENVLRREREEGGGERTVSYSQAKKVEKEMVRQRAKTRKSAAAG